MIGHLGDLKIPGIYGCSILSMRTIDCPENILNFCRLTRIFSKSATCPEYNQQVLYPQQQTPTHLQHNFVFMSRQNMQEISTSGIRDIFCGNLGSEFPKKSAPQQNSPTQRFSHVFSAHFRCACLASFHFGVFAKAPIMLLML